MTIEFDPKYEPLVILVAGSKVPRVSPNQARALGDAYEVLSGLVRDLGESVRAQIGSVEGAVSERMGKGFRDFIHKLVESLPQLEKSVHELSGSLRKLALDVEQGTYSMLIEIIFFVNSILWALASPFTAPLVPGFITSARFAIGRIAEKMHWAARLLAEAIQEGVEEVLQDVAVQLIQFAEGNRNAWDTFSIGMSALGGAVAGGVAGGMHIGMNNWRPGVGNSVLFHGATEAVADIAAGATGAAVGGGGFGDLW
ncbi:hypothetical protein, partial [Crossiella cryophila]|uniref:WXG100-like domain-containing protein n=1 Tax=Crossiella cryophila TaxID=43355 RepID=UPI0031EE3F30